MKGLTNSASGCQRTGSINQRVYLQLSEHVIEFLSENVRVFSL